MQGFVLKQLSSMLIHVSMSGISVKEYHTMLSHDYMIQLKKKYIYVYICCNFAWYAWTFDMTFFLLIHYRSIFSTFIFSCEILVQFICLLFLYIYTHNFYLWWQSWVFSVTWYFRNHWNMLIYCSIIISYYCRPIIKNGSYYYQCC